MRVRLLASLLPVAILLVPASGRAQNRPLTAEVHGGAEYTSNARVVPEDQTEESDTILRVNPSVQGQLERRGFRATLKYELNYWHFQQNDDLDRAHHDLDARAALTWWESVDLEGYQRLVPTPKSFAEPIDNPVSTLQASHTGGKIAYRREFGPSTRAIVGYTGERVMYIESHKTDTKPPQYFLHDPGVVLERDLSAQFRLGLGYRYRVQMFDDAGAPPAGDLRAHVVTLRPYYETGEWLTVDGAFGVQAVTFDGPGVDPGLRLIIDLRVRAGGEIVGIAFSYADRFAEDVSGNPATIRLARVDLGVTPFAPWFLNVGTAYGSQDFETNPAFPDASRSFVEAHGGLGYKISVGVIEVGASYHTTLKEGPAAAVNVMRASLSLGGRF